MRNRTSIKIMAGLVSLAVVLIGAGYSRSTSGKETGGPVDGVAKAVAVLHPTAGNKVHGIVTFTQEGTGVKVSAHLEGLTPGKHGFHLHEWGDCSAGDGTSAGGHFNPGGMQHGARTAKMRHAGDLGNIEAGEDGKAHVEFTDPMLKLDGANSIIGRGVIVHAKADDFMTQPTGDAGGRQACGVVGVAKP